MNFVVNEWYILHSIFWKGVGKGMGSDYGNILVLS